MCLDINFFANFLQIKNTKNGVLFSWLGAFLIFFNKVDFYFRQHPC